MYNYVDHYFMRISDDICCLSYQNGKSGLPELHIFYRAGIRCAREREQWISGTDAVPCDYYEKPEKPVKLSPGGRADRHVEESA